MEQFNHVSLLVIEPDLNKRPEAHAIEYYTNLGYSVHKNTKSERGKPDFTILQNSEIQFFVEVKSNNDPIAPQQFEWFIKNKEKPIIIFYVKYDKELITLKKQVKTAIRYDPNNTERLKKIIEKNPKIINLLSRHEKNRVIKILNQ